RMLGLEFLPKLEEGNLWIRATLPPTISLQEGNSYVNEMRKLIAALPEVESVVSQHGRPDDGTDAAGFFNAEFFAPLKPAKQWPRGEDKDDLTGKLLAQLQDKFPGVEFNFSQYLQDNVSEAVSGVKGENSIKLFGNDLQALTNTANKIKSVLATVQGITDLAVFTSRGPRAMASRPATSTPPSAPRSAATAPATSTSPAATAISRSSCGWRRNTARARSRSRICGSAPRARTASPRCRSARSPPSSWCRARPISIASSRSAICRSSSRCASATSAAPSRKRSRRSLNRSRCRRARGSNGSASSAICRTRSSGCRSWCRSA